MRDLFCSELLSSERENQPVSAGCFASGWQFRFETRRRICWSRLKMWDCGSGTSNMLESGSALGRSAATCPRPVDAILEVIRASHKEPGITLASVSRDVGVSSRHAARLLKRWTGATFRDHLNGLRISSAIPLLLEGCLPIKCIASVVGFASASHFHRKFRARMHSTPRRFVAANRPTERASMSGAPAPLPLRMSDSSIKLSASGTK